MTTARIDRSDWHPPCDNECPDDYGGIVAADFVVDGVPLCDACVCERCGVRLERGECERCSDCETEVST